jgi:hypothetical protein
VKTVTVVGTSIKIIRDRMRRKEQGTYVISSLRTRGRDFLTVKPPLSKYGSFVFLFFFTPYALNFQTLSDVHIIFLGQVMGPGELLPL